MARIKNAITGYFIEKWNDATPPTTATKELAAFISTVTPNNTENVEETGFYSGDGTPEKDVTSVANGYDFEGMYDSADAAMKIISDMRFLTGSDRKVAFQMVDPDGTKYFGKATVTDPIANGGEATEYADFSCTITWDQKPTITPPTP